MIRRATALFLLLGLAAAGGCGVCRTAVCDPFGCGPIGGCEPCGVACEEPCGPGPLRSRCGWRGGVAGPCADDCCPQCGVLPCRCRRGIIRGPLSLIFGLFHVGDYRACGPCGGCGERYWGDWYGGEPPECGNCCAGGGNVIGGEFPPYGAAVGPVDGMPQVYEGGGMVPSGGGCRNCGQGGHASQSHGPPQQVPAALANSSRMSRYAAGGQGFTSPSSYAAQRYPIRGSSRPQPYATQQGYSSPAEGVGPYAPRLISTTDHVVKPATTEQGPRLAQPQRSDVRQE